MSPESGSSVVSVPTSPGGVMFSSMEELESEMLVGAEVSGGGSISVNSMLKPVRGLLPIKSDMSLKNPVPVCNLYTRPYH